MKTDRRAERTRDLLKGALFALMGEKQYDDISIQDIVDRANVGRTTFYLHYQNKDELFLALQPILGNSVGGTNTLAEWQSAEPPGALIALCETIRDGARPHALTPTRAQSDSMLLINLLHRLNVRALHDNLRGLFDETTSAVPFVMLAEAMTAAQIRLIVWWSESRAALTPHEMARTIHHMQRSILSGAIKF